MICSYTLVHLLKNVMVPFQEEKKTILGPNSVDVAQNAAIMIFWESSLSNFY